MNRYEAYKDSGVEWIGDIPAGWEVRPAKHYISIANGSNPINAGDIPVYGSGGSSFKTCGEYKQPPAILLGRKGTLDAPCYIDHKYWNVDTAFDATSGSSDLSLRYYYYLAICFDYDRYQTSTAVPSMAQSDYANMRIPVPPRGEQRAIVDFLDKKTAEIDGLVADCEREVELLQEYRKAVISEAVTKGLDPNVPMKDSGVEWIGEIPVGWRLECLKHLLEAFIDCPHETPKYSAEGDFCVIRTADQEQITLRPDRYMYKLDAKEYRRRIRRMPLNKGDIVYGREGRWGIASIVPLNGRYCLGQRMVQFRCDASSVMSEFLVAALNAQYVVMQGKFDAFGSTTPHVNVETIRNYRIALPSLAEQRVIATYLDAKTAEIDSLIDSKRQMIEKLREYRKSLISEAVTGKFKVPGV